MTQRPPRLPLIDALRGFAQLGVFLVNLRFFSLDALMTEAAQQALPSAALDHALRTGMEWLLDMKAITLFSLLFGMSVAMQMEDNTPGRMAAHLRRMALLPVVGLLHSLLLWWGTEGIYSCPEAWRSAGHGPALPQHLSRSRA